MKKKFLIPEAIVISFENEDIITDSDVGPQDEYGDTGTEWWGQSNP